MPQFIECALHGNVAVITLNNPPVNALSAGKDVVQGLMDAIRQGLDDPQVEAIVLMGAGRCFSGGADIAEFGRAPVPGVPTIRDLTAFLDRVRKPAFSGEKSPIRRSSSAAFMRSSMKAPE